MFDLTRQIVLNQKAQKTYNRLRVILHAAFLLSILFVADRILFPSRTLNLFFENINSSKNTLVNPRLSDGRIPPKGAIGSGDTFTFDANPLGNFSAATFTIKTDGRSGASGVILSTRKSHQAFFYPTGDPIGFKSGSLLTTADGNYYIVSNGILRKFENTNIILEFGFPKDAFILVSENDLKFNTLGPDITSSNTYPDDSLFLIDGKYYQLKNMQLLPFISDRAFLSQYQTISAVSKNDNFFNTYPAAENYLGFANGTLASSAESVFILSEGKSFPIADLNTFLAMGFSWDNVIALGSDELGLYERQKQFDLNQPHPSGTMFFDSLENKYFVIDNGKKRPILSNEILKTYPSKLAISAQQESLEKKVECQLEKQMLPANTFSCEMSLDAISANPGNDYQIAAKFDSEIKIKQVDANFSTPLTWANLRSSLSRIKENLKNNYSK